MKLVIREKKKYSFTIFNEINEFPRLIVNSKIKKKPLSKIGNNNYEYLI